MNYKPTDPSVRRKFEAAGLEFVSDRASERFEVDLVDGYFALVSDENWEDQGIQTDSKCVIQIMNGRCEICDTWIGYTVDGSIEVLKGKME